MKPQTAIRQSAAGLADFTVTPEAVALTLDAVEVEYGLTFMALPTNALRDLRITWETKDDAHMQARAVQFLRDLFNGMDGHLVAIDAVLEEGFQE